MPPEIRGKKRDEFMVEHEKAALQCPACSSLTRPHVLWFDESYDETNFRFESSLSAAAKTDLLIIVGTSGATNLPNQVAWQVRHRGGTIIDINIEHNPFTELALNSGNGFFLKESSGSALPAIVNLFREIILE